MCPIAAAALALFAAGDARRELRLVTLDPATFTPRSFIPAPPFRDFSRDAYIYSPVTCDGANFWASVSNLVSRSKDPAFWRFHTYNGTDFLERMLAEKRGDVVMLSGRKRPNSRTHRQEHRSRDERPRGQARDLPRLEKILADAERRNLAAYDCMTQRFDIAYQLQRELVNDHEIFGGRQPGTADHPAVEMTSSHFLLKTFNGVATLRPVWYFDIRRSEAVADVGTHVVDLTHWTLFPDQALDYRKDIRLLAAKLANGHYARKLSPCYRRDRIPLVPSGRSQR